MSESLPSAPVEDDPTKPLQPDKSLSELMGQLTHDFGDLVSTQVELAKVEIKEEVARAGKGASLLGGGAFVGYLAVLLLSFAVAWGLADLFDDKPWLGFLIVGIIYAIVAAVLLMKGRERMNTVNAVPPKTAATLKEDVQWAKQQMS